MITNQEQRLINRALLILEREYLPPLDSIRDDDTAAKIVALELSLRKVISLLVIYLDNQNNVILSETLKTGTPSGCQFHPCEPLQRAMELGASSIILGRNSTGGSLSFSDSDKRMFHQIREGGKCLDINALDYIVVNGAGKHVSFKGTEG